MKPLFTLFTLLFFFVLSCSQAEDTTSLYVGLTERENAMRSCSNQDRYWLDDDTIPEVGGYCLTFLEEQCHLNVPPPVPSNYTPPQDALDNWSDYQWAPGYSNNWVGVRHEVDQVHLVRIDIPSFIHASNLYGILEHTGVTHTQYTNFYYFEKMRITVSNSNGNSLSPTSIRIIGVSSGNPPDYSNYAYERDLRDTREDGFLFATRYHSNTIHIPCDFPAFEAVLEETARY